jgi:poly(ADP-ribose) glycohydrolase ARH3
MNEDRFTGCMLGLALGDACGAPYEGGPVERLLWRLIGTTRQGEMRWTDDTQMSLDLAESIIDKRALDPDDVALRFGSSYRWSRGYGPGAAKLLKRIAKGQPWQQANRAIFPAGSYGNGGAMRAPMIGLLHARHPDQLADAARLSASITHAHPLGMEGAALLATATALALGTRAPLAILQGAAAACTLTPFTTRLATADTSLRSGTELTPRQVRQQLGNGMAAAHSCVTALYLAQRFLDRPFAELLAFAAACGGDVDTISAMAGAVWGAANGAAALPQAQLARLEQAERVRSAGQRMHALFGVAHFDAGAG